MVVGCSFDTLADNSAFASRQNFPFPLLCDTSRAIGLAYGACDNPKAGYPQRISYLIGEDGMIVRAYGQVNARSHPAEVLADLTPD